MRSDQNNLTYKRYEKFYASFNKPKTETVEKSVVKKTSSIKLKDLLFPSS